MERKEHYIVVSENEIVKAEMPLPLCWDKFQPDQKHPDIGLTKTGYYQCVAFQDHCLSLPRIPIKGKHKWEVWQSVVEGKDFELEEKFVRNEHIEEYDALGNLVVGTWFLHAIPIQPTPECNHEPLIDTGIGYYHCPACNEGWTYEEWRSKQPTSEVKTERFKRPTDQQIVNAAILFNDGKVEKKKLSDMVALCDFVIDRLYENGDMTIPSSKENK